MNKNRVESGFWIELPEEAVIVSKPENYANLAYLIDCMRGERTIEKFAAECKISAGTLFRTYNGERIRPMLYKHLKAMFEHRDPDCSVDFDDLLAANGMVSAESIDEAKNKVKTVNANLEKQTDCNIHHRTEKKEREEEHPSEKVVQFISSAEMPESDDDSDTAMTYRQYIRDLALYAQGLSKDEYFVLSCKMEELFKNKWFVDVLGKYCASHDANIETNKTMLVNFFATGKGLEDLDRSAQHYRDLLDDSLGFTSRVSKYCRG